MIDDGSWRAGGTIFGRIKGMSWDVIGHEWAENLLAGHIRRGEVRHAYLFAGPPGIGRRSMALRFIQALNCPSPLEPGQPCRTCRTCQQIERMQHIDLSVVQAERQGGILKVEQVRELQQSINLLPYEASYRVALLLRFQEANANAQNALLKTLEEAPARVVLLLTADSPDELLPTIASRCEVLRLRPLALERLEAELIARGLDETQARLLAHVSGGRLGYALNLKDDPALLEARGTLLEDWLTLLPAARAERFVYAEGLARGERSKDGLRLALVTWLAAWRDVMLAAASPELPLANPDYAEQIRQLAGQVGFSQARSCARALERGLGQLDANVNARLLAEVLLLDWPRV
jgi:DNA polymerase-3 subunit delta'